jgi:predicted AAA+ superfamily ATPase
MIKRALKLPTKLDYSVFLLGQRSVGKSYLLKSCYPDALYIDLLETDTYNKYQASPKLLREEIIALKERKQLKKNLVIIDEVQKIPELLNEVHLLIERYGINFILCGSSARKLKRQGVNMLGGRAIKQVLFGFNIYELQEDKSFNLEKYLSRGYTPRHYLSDKYKTLTKGYIDNYLKEEILIEGLVRNLPAFRNFLEATSFSDGEIVNYENIASDCHVSSPTVKAYFQILEDTLIASFLPSYTKKPKRRVIQAPKFYYHDVGIVNILQKRNEIKLGNSEAGKAFENAIYHELQSYISYTSLDTKLSYWRLTTDIEVDFIIGDMELAIEAKSGEAKKTSDLKGLREIIKDHPKTKKRILVCNIAQSRKTDDEIWILSLKDFIHDLWAGELF